MAGLLSQVTSVAETLPSRVFLYAREKWGKSSLFAHAPGAIFFMSRGETGLLELIAGGRVPPTPHFPYQEQSPPTWRTLQQSIKALREEEHKYRFFVLDTCNGAEILCQEHVRNTAFKGSHAKFVSYGKGWEECRLEWLGLLQDLDALRSTRKMAIILLAHTQVKKFDDPTAEESYDKYKPACQDKLWDLTHRWSDIICFGHFKAQTYETEGGKTKARTAVSRILCFDQSPVWEAGNRYGITGELDVGNGAKNAFGAFAKLVSEAKASSLAAKTPVSTAAPEGEQRPDPQPTSSAPPASVPSAADSSAPTAAPSAPATAGGEAPKVMPAAEQRTEAPGGQHQQAPATPEYGADFASWVAEVDARLADDQLCPAGTVKVRLLEVFGPKGMTTDWQRWNKGAIELAMGTIRNLEELLSRPLVLEAKSLLVLKGVSWSRFVGMIPDAKLTADMTWYHLSDSHLKVGIWSLKKLTDRKAEKASAS